MNCAVTRPEFRPWNSNISIRIMSKEEDIFRQKVYRYQIEG